MTTYSPESQRNFSIQWFKSWSEFQKDDFVAILAQKVAPSGTLINGIVNGIQKLETSERPASLFSCQVKLFNEWWETWSESDRDKMVELLKEADSKFWETVDLELKGTRKTLNEDFMIVTVSNEQLENDNMNGNIGNGDSPAPPPVFKVKQIVTGNSNNGNGLVEEHNYDDKPEENIDKTTSDPPANPEGETKNKDQNQDVIITTSISTEI